MINNDQLISDDRDFARLIMRLGHTVAADGDKSYILMKGLNIVFQPYPCLTPKEIIDCIDDIIGHRHVMCKACHAVLLQQDHGRQVIGVVERMNVYGRKLEYRAASEGPNSEPIAACSQCGSVLNEDSVKEITS